VEPEPEAATLAGPSNQGSRTPGDKGRENADGEAVVVKGTPPPWAQLSSILFLEIAEALTAGDFSSEFFTPYFGAIGYGPSGLN